MKQDFKNNLQAMKRQINQATMRIHNIRKRNSDCKKQIMTNRQLTNRILAQKQHMALSLIQQQKMQEKLKMQEKMRIQMLKKRNFEQKKKHWQEIRDIMTALHMVKADEASQLKRISKLHNQKLRQMSDSQLETNKRNKIRIKSEQGKNKEAYWKQKLYRLYSENQNQKLQRSQIIAERSNKLGQLLEHSHSLQKEYELAQKQQMLARRQYHSAVALPVRKIASAIKKSNPQILEKVKEDQIDQILRSQYYEKYENSQKKHPAFLSSVSTKLSEQKLKIILEKLRQKKNGSEYTEQDN